MFLVGLKDNKAVYVASNLHSVDSTGTCQRYSRTDRKMISLPVPDSIHKYNKHMGGVDLLDNMVAAYRVGVRSKK